MCRTEAISCLPQIVTLRDCEEKDLISEEIKSLALAVLQLCSKALVSQSEEKCIKYGIFKIS